MKKKTIYTSGVLIFVFFSAVLFLTGCSSAVKLTSDWKKSDMVIDGRQNDWEGSLYLLKKANVLIGVRNDSVNLYICFITDDPSAKRQIMRNGLTVWLDPKGGSSERCGIKFPLGAKFNGPKEPGSNASAAAPENDSPPPIIDSTNGIRSHADDNKSRQYPSADLFSRTGADDIQKSVQFILTDEDRTQDLLLIELRAMEVKYSAGRNTFVYELKVPLHKTAEFPFELNPKNGVIGIGFKSEFKKENSNSGPSMNMGEPGGRSGPGGTGGNEMEEPGGGREGRGGGRSRTNTVPRSSEEMDIWVKAVLAAPGPAI